MEPSKNAVRERPILFSGPMVRAILEGRKTQTRRVVVMPRSMQAAGYVFDDRAYANGQKLSVYRPKDQTGAVADHFGPIYCPYGQPGDRLWVRETFFDHGPFDPAHPELTKREERVEYREDPWDRKGDPEEAGGWSPSIHMPRWASRLTLEITEVRVERLQEITREDCIAEGCPGWGAQDWETREWDGEYPEEEYRRLWDSLNAGRGYGWEKNPWVWVISFASRSTPRTTTGER